MSTTHVDIDTSLPPTPTGLLVDGRWRESSAGAVFPVVDPGTEEVLGHVADATVSDAVAALDAAVEAQAAWAAQAPRDRSDILRRAFDLMQERAPQLARLATLEMGKPLAESLGEVRYAAEFLRWYSEEAVRLDGGYRVSPDGTARSIVLRRPVGPCLLVTPWNFPLAMITRKAGPALAAGCTVVVKPAEQTPLCALAIGQLLVDAGVPAGVVNVITTTTPRPVVAALLQDRRLRKLSFTGSTVVGQRLAEAAAGGVLRVSLELGGNAPFVVLDDADLDRAVDGALVAKMRNMGEACTAANRFLVAAPVADEFTRRLTDRMRALRVGHGLQETTDVGPLVDAAARARVTTVVQAARDAGARLVLGGESLDRPGYYLPPTVLADVPPDTLLVREEIFGPVAPVSVVTSDEQALELANDTAYGLTAYVYTRDLARARRFMEQLDVGMVGLNRGMVSDPSSPFGGVKLSGIGREGGREGILEYLETTYVAMDAA